MCELAAYLGPRLLLAEVSGLMESGSGRDAYGFGLGWYAPDGSPAVYTRSKPPAWDKNLPHLERSLDSNLWLVHFRLEAAQAASHQTGPQPYCDDEFIFGHCGVIEGFRDRLSPLMRQFMAPEVEAGISGTTASEYLFGLLRHLLQDDDDISVDQALGQMFELLDNWLENEVALLNIILSDGETLCAARHAINAECAPLYFTTDVDDYPGAQLIASSPLTASAFWQPIPEHHLLILDPAAPPELVALG